MAQLKDTIIQGTLEIQGKDSEGKALILPEESKIYIGNEPFTGGASSEEIQQMGFITNDKIGGEELGLVKDGGNVTINADGTMTAPKCAVDDVQIEGTTIVGEDGIAKIKKASKDKLGVVGIDESLGIGIHFDGDLKIKSASNQDIDNHIEPFLPIVPSNLDYAVKAAMCDGKGEAWTAEEQAAAIERIGLKDSVKYKYFNFIEEGVNVAGNPTYDEIKEAILSDVTPVLIHEHYIAYMTSGHWDAEAFEREELPGFTFVTHRSNMNNHWKIKYTEFWCTKQDDGSTLWAVGEHYYIEDFVAEYGVTTFDEIQNAYNEEKIMFCTHGGFVTKLDILAPNSYAQFSGLDDMGNPALLKVTKDNVWTRTNVTNATLNYVDGLFNTVSSNVSSVNSNVNVLIRGVDSMTQYINGKAPLLSALSSMNTVDILKSVYSFRGEPRNSAGTLHIKNPGIYLIMQGGAGNKQIIINQNGTEALNETWNGIIVLAYESGVITPIGIETSLTIAGAFKTPGTFQGWTSDGKYSTTIKYPAKCVVSYLGNGDVDYLA